MRYMQKKKVSASLCGTDAKLSAVGVLSLVEDSLTELTGELKIDGLTVRNKYGATLVFFRNYIKFFRAADWNTPIIVESFVSSKSLIRFCIDTCIKTLNEEMIAYSRIELCGIDLVTKKIRKIETIGVDETVEAEAPLCDTEFGKKRKAELSFVERVTVRTSNIDYVHHTNNIEYIRFLMNTFTVEELEKQPVLEMEINYAEQTFEGDVLEIYKTKEQDTVIFEIKKDGKPVLNCRMLRISGARDNGG